METCFERVNPLSKTRMILLFLHYFLGYQFVYPMLLTSFTLWLDPVARVVPDWLQFLLYCYMIGAAVWLAFPLLKESVQGWKKNRMHMIKLCFFLFGAYYISSIIINLIILLDRKSVV